MTRLKYGKRFAGTGLGQTPTVSELHGLGHTARKKQSYYNRVRVILKEKAENGDEIALYKLKKLHLAQHSQRSKKKPTKVKLKFLENEIPD